MTTDTTQRDIGSLQSDVRSIKEDQADMKADIREVRDFMREAKGSWKMLVFLATVSAALGSLGTKIIGLFWPVMK